MTFPTSCGAIFAIFLQAANAEVEQTVRQAVDGKVAQLLPEAADGARGKIAAEIYRELDAALKNDHGLLDQVKSGLANLQQNGNTGAQQAKSLALLIANRAKALLPGVARRVVGEWTSTVLSASQAKRTKQAAAASRADVGIGGAPGPVAVRPARISYGTMSDEDILNAE